MKTGFKDALAVKKKVEGNSPWNFTAPHYDERSSCYVSAGSNYGVGVRTPTGTINHEAKPDAVPKGRVNTMDTDSHGETYSFKGSPHSTY